jgi:hypothetical protein
MQKFSLAVPVAITVLCGAVYGQSLTLASATATAGGTVALNLSISSPSGSEPAAVQWTFTYPASSIASLNVTAGAAATAAGKSVACAGSAAAYTCIVSGLNSNIISNGVVAVVTATLTATASTATIGISGVEGATAAGAVVTVSGTGSSLAIAPTAAPPTLTSVACNPASLGSGASSTCTVTLGGAAPAGTAVTLTSSSANLTVPASVTVATGSKTATFTATAGSFSSDQTVTVTGKLNSSSVTTSVSLVAPVTVSAVQCTASNMGQNTSTSCTVTLSKAAPSGGAVVTLAASSAALTVPGSVTVPATAASAPFTASTGTITTSVTATITASLNRTSASASLTLSSGPLSSSPAISSLKCAVSTLTPNTGTNCTATLTSAAPTGGVALTVSKSSAVLTAPASITVPANAVSTTFPVAAGAFTTAIAPTVSVSTGWASVSTTLSLATAAPSLGLIINGVGNELAGVSNGSAITPAFAPNGLSGQVVVNGSGSVNLVSGGGVYFLNCCANTNNAYYKLAGAALSSVFNVPQGQIAFNLHSRYTFAQRKASAATGRDAFDAVDGSGQHQYYFRTQISGSSLVFYYMIGGTISSYTVPAGKEDTLFGSGVSLDVVLGWNGTTATLSLNGTVVKSTPYVPAAQNWTAASVFDFGAFQYQGAGVNSLDDTIQHFSVAPTNTTSQLTVIRLNAVPGKPNSGLLTDGRRTRPVNSLTAQIASVACDAELRAGTGTICELRLGTPSAEAASFSLSSSSEHVRVPATVSVRPGQAGTHFEVLSDPSAAQGAVSVEAQSAGGDTVETSLQVAGPGSVNLLTPGRQRGIPGTPVQFEVVAIGSQPSAISTSGLPSGASFDTSSGTFSWIPTAQDLGRHTLTFTATNSLGVGTSKTVVVDVAADPVEGGPEILTVGDSGQALAMHSGSSILAAIPNALYDGQPARPGDVVSLSATGIDCNQNPASRTFQLKLGMGYVPVQSIAPTENAPEVCSISFEVPATAVGPRVPVSLDVAGPDGRVRSSNGATIAVEE